jgi:pilus assembly protein CpaB
MRPKSLILLVLALGCGLVASIGINQVMANRTPQAAAPMEDSTPIYVALTEIGLGDPLKPEVLKLTDWPKDRVPPGALTKLEETEGRRTRAKIFPGEPIIEGKLLAKGEAEGSATDLIPKGFRVVSIRVDSVSGAASLIHPGDRVDVLVHIEANASRGISRTATTTFLQMVKVFAVDDVFRRENNGEQAVAAKTISLLVTPAQAELVTLATEMGIIRLVMRSADDQEAVETMGATTGQLTGAPEEKNIKPDSNPLLNMINGTPPVPAPVVAPPPVVQAAPEPEPVVEAKKPTFKMILLEGDRKSEIEFENDQPINSPGANSPAAETAPPDANSEPTSPDAGEEKGN